MRRSYPIVVAALLVAALFTAAPAGAIVLWDQGTINTDPSAAGQANSFSSGFGGTIAYGVQDVTVPANENWVVMRITQYYGGFNSGWLSLTQGYLYVQPKTGALPTTAPGGATIPMSCSIDAARSALLNQTVYAVTAVVNIPLGPGDYWIGITPVGSAGINGINRQWPATTVGDPVATWFQPGPWTNTYAPWDGTILIEGDMAIPTQDTTWGKIKSLYQ